MEEKLQVAKLLAKTAFLEKKKTAHFTGAGRAD